MSIKKNEIWALLRFNWNYTAALKDRVTTGRDSTDEVVDHSFLEFWVDDSGNFFKIIEIDLKIQFCKYISDKYMSILIERDVTLSLADALKNLVGSCEDSLDKVISYPIKVKILFLLFNYILFNINKLKFIFNFSQIHDALYGTNLGSFTHFVTPGTVCMYVQIFSIINNNNL